MRAGIELKATECVIRERGGGFIFASAVLDQSINMLSVCSFVAGLGFVQAATERAMVGYSCTQVDVFQPVARRVEKPVDHKRNVSGAVQRAVNAAGVVRRYAIDEVRGDQVEGGAAARGVEVAYQQQVASLLGLRLSQANQLAGTFPLVCRGRAKWGYVEVGDGDA